MALRVNSVLLITGGYLYCSCCRLMNLGNTCYMNVIVQCLYNLSSFVTGMERFFGPLVKQRALEVNI
jgi:uncharacterized UBP type Zn finger protein